MKLAICCATMHPNPNVDGSIFRSPGEIPTATARTVTHCPVYIQWNTPENNLGVLGSYQKLYGETGEDILMYLHDDVTIREQEWDQRILAAFEDPKVGVVGLGGALNHGSEELYKRPYELTQLARSSYLSNTDDAEHHGERFTGIREVAVVDGFSLAVRRILLDRCGGWHPDIWPPHHLYDYVICAEAHRYSYRVMCVGIRCHHHGGRTATSSAYQEWAAKTKWGSDAEMHRIGHRLFYEEFRDVMPWRCK